MTPSPDTAFEAALPKPDAWMAPDGPPGLAMLKEVMGERPDASPYYTLNQMRAMFDAGWKAAIASREAEIATQEPPVAQSPEQSQPSAHDAGDVEGAPKERPVSNRCSAGEAAQQARGLASSPGDSCADRLGETKVLTDDETSESP